MACTDLDLLWKEYFRDPSQFWDNRNSKRASSFPDFRHKQTRKPLWTDGWHNPPWVQAELRKRSRVKDAEFCTVWKTPQDPITILDLIKDCGRRKDLHQGSRIHADILKTGLLRKDIYVGTSLLHMYAKCGALAKAQEVFDELPTRNLVSWNALIAAYAQHGLGEQALDWFRRMRDEGFSPNRITFLCVLKACGNIGATEKGEEVHAEVRRLGLLDHDIVLGTALVDMYAKCGALAKAQEVFYELPTRNVVSWTALITGYARHGLGDEALICFGRMRDEGFSPDTITFICILKACGSIRATKKGEEIHAEIHRLGLLENHDIMLGTALVDMYAKCGVLAKAEEVFDELPTRNVVSWNALLAGYVQHGLNGEALNCFDRMQHEGFSPNTVTFICILKACGSIGATKKGEEIHAEVYRLGLLENHDIVLGSALVDMYAKCGVLAKAQHVFDELPTRNIVSWTALISGYAQHGLGDKALNCFWQMREEGFSPDIVTFVCILKACGSIGATEQGGKIHAEVLRLGLLENHVIVLGNALVDMYAKCGALAKAQEVFDELPTRDVLSWTALVAGYAALGKAKGVFNLFKKMIGEHIEPDGVTFLVLLTACSHAGLVEEGLMYFDTMSTVYCITPTLEHHICMVDLFSRAGHFDKAISVIEKLPVIDLWLALLVACRKWVNVELGRWAFEHAVRLDANCASAYVCMSNIYAAAGMQEEADKVDALRMKKGSMEVDRR